MFYKADVISVVLEALIFAICCYIFVALAYFLCRNKKLRRERGGSNSATHHGERYKRIFIAFYASYGLSVCAKSILAFVYFQDIYIWNRVRCATVAITHQLIHVAATAELFIYLWLRQHILYRNIYFSRLSTPRVLWFSRILLVAMCVTAVAFTVSIPLTITKSAFKASNSSCVQHPPFTKNDPQLIGGFCFVLFLHGCIFFLFANILWKQQALFHKSRTHFQGGGWTAIGQLRQLVRSYAIATCISSVTELFTNLLEFVLRGRLNTMVMNLIWDIDMVVNLVCILSCFTNWKEMTFPWFAMKNKLVRLSSNRQYVKTTAFSKTPPCVATAENGHQSTKANMASLPQP